MSKTETKEQLKRAKTKEEYAKLLSDYFKSQNYYKTVQPVRNPIEDFNGVLI